MTTPKKNIPEKSDFLRVAGYITTIFVFIGAGFGVGQYFKAAMLDNDKLRLERHNIALSDSIVRLQEIIKNEEVTRANFISLNTHYLYFNSDSSDQHTLTVSNSMLNPCERGKVDGCWKKETIVNIGDVIGVQVYFRNRGDLPVGNVSLGYGLSYTNSMKTAVLTGGIVVGNIIVSRGIVYVYAKERIKLVYMPELTNLLRNEKSKDSLAVADTLLGLPNFKVGTVPAGEGSQGVLIVRFKVEKAD